MDRIVISEAALNLHRVAAKERGRYALHGIKVEEDGTAMAADGRMLLAVGPVPDAVADQAETDCDFTHDQLQEPVMVEADQLKEARKNLPNKKSSGSEWQRKIAELTMQDDGSVSITTSGQHDRTISGAPVEGQWPDLNTILQGGDARAKITFNACIMEQLCSAMRRAAGESKRGQLDVTLTVKGRDEPMTMRAVTEDHQHMAAALSPIIPDDYNPLRDDEPITMQGDTPSRWEQLLAYPGDVRREVSALWSLADGADDRADRLAEWPALHDRIRGECEARALPDVPADYAAHDIVRRFHGAAAPTVG